MTIDPLEPPPSDSAALSLFLEHFTVRRILPPEELLREAASAFSRIPYENLTKLIKLEEAGSAEGARRFPREVLADHISLGAGGTCFSLTAALLHVLRALGFEAQPILADRRYGPNTHCALLVFLESGLCLLDPGFLITRPVPLGGLSQLRLPTEFNDVILTRRAGDRIDLHTIQRGNRTYRLTFKASPADRGEFLKAWDESFGWDMMRYPLLTRIAGGQQFYLQGRRFQVRGRESLSRTEIGLGELSARIAGDFGLDPRIAERAIEILRRKGEMHGDPPTP